MRDYFISYQFAENDEKSGRGGFGEHRFATDEKVDFAFLDERKKCIKSILETEGLKNPSIVILNLVKLD